jgi:hypothetical protein
VISDRRKWDAKTEFAVKRLPKTRQCDAGDSIYNKEQQLESDELI